jgi:hypothetical protein
VKEEVDHVNHCEVCHCCFVVVAGYEPVQRRAEGLCALLDRNPAHDVTAAVWAAEAACAGYGLEMDERKKMTHHQSLRLVSRPEAPLKCPVRQENQAQL